MQENRPSIRFREARTARRSISRRTTIIISPAVIRPPSPAIVLLGTYPVGLVSANEEAAERAFAGADNDLRYHFNLPNTLTPTDLVSISFDALNLDDPLRTVRPIPATASKSISMACWSSLRSSSALRNWVRRSQPPIHPGQRECAGWFRFRQHRQPQRHQLQCRRRRQMDGH